MAEALDAEWFLVANKDKLSIKIRGQVTLGEDDRGLLTLESKKDGERWFTLSVDPQDSLVLSELGAQWEVESPGAWVSQQPGVVCIPGTLLSLPNNEVYISHNLLRGKVQQHLVVRPAELPVVDEPDVDIVVPEAPTEEDFKAESEELLITTLPPGSSIEVPEPESAPEAKREIPTLTTPVESTPIHRPEVSEPQQSARKAWVGFGLLAVAAGAGYFYWQTGGFQPQPLEPVQSTSSTIAPTAEASEARQLEVAAPQLEPPTHLDPVRETIAVTNEIEDADDTVAAEKDWQQEISEARFLMDRGFINYPERNTVSILGEILAAVPEHVEAWELLNQATDIYLTDARRAYEDGFIDAALEMVTEVERFHPNYAGLTQIRSELSQTPSN